MNIEKTNYLEITPFDNHYMFTLLDESNELLIPIDLINVGSIFLVFSDDRDEIRIPQHPNTNLYRLIQGEVLFKINKDQAKLILNKKISTFSIINQLESGETSCLYTGVCGTQSSLNLNQIDALSLEIKLLKENNEKLNAALNALNLENQKNLVTIEQCNANIMQLNQKVLELVKENSQLALAVPNANLNALNVTPQKNEVTLNKTDINNAKTSKKNIEQIAKLFNKIT